MGFIRVLRKVVLILSATMFVAGVGLMVLVQVSPGAVDWLGGAILSLVSEPEREAPALDGLFGYTLGEVYRPLQTTGLVQKAMADDGVLYGMSRPPEPPDWPDSNYAVTVVPGSRRIATIIGGVEFDDPVSCSNEARRWAEELQLEERPGTLDVSRGVGTLWEYSSSDGSREVTLNCSLSEDMLSGTLSVVLTDTALAERAEAETQRLATNSPPIAGAFGYTLGEVYEVSDAERPVEQRRMDDSIVYRVSRPPDAPAWPEATYVLQVTPDERRIGMIGGWADFDDPAACSAALEGQADTLRLLDFPGNLTIDRPNDRWAYSAPGRERRVLLHCSGDDDQGKTRLRLSVVDTALLDAEASEPSSGNS